MQLQRFEAITIYKLAMIYICILTEMKERSMLNIDVSREEAREVPKSNY